MRWDDDGEEGGRTVGWQGRAQHVADALSSLPSI